MKTEMDITRLPTRQSIGVPAILCILLLMVGCGESVQFPRDYTRVKADVRMWQNSTERFSLVLITNPNRVQGFAEWGRVGIYGRIVNVSKSGSSMSIDLGDGGMNGVRLLAIEKGSKIEVHCELPNGTSQTLRNQVSSAKIVADRVRFNSAIRIYGGELKERQSNGRDVSIRLQYVASSRLSEQKTLDEVLRRGKSIRDAAIFRRTQQEESPLTIYDQSAPETEGGGVGISSTPPSKPPLPPLIFEEIQYPVYESAHILSVATQRYRFDGGAHGAASTDFDVIDVARRTQLRADDILKEGWKKALLPALSEELLRQGSYTGIDTTGGLKALGLFEAELSPPDKVFVCMTGLGFEYDRYRIAPWAMGEYIVVLPWDQVTAYLKDAIKPF